MPLQNLQLEFAEAIFSGDEMSAITPSENLSIYRNNIMTSLKDTLHDIYPLVLKLVGEAFFRLTIKEYIKRYPSRSSDLHDYGEYFSDFLTEYQPLKNLNYLSEVAKFEWACHTIFFAADHAGFDIEQLKKFSPDQYEKLRLSLHPASKLIKFHFPILRIIDLCANEIDGTIDVSDGGVNLLIIRRDLDISLVSLSLSEFLFLSALDEGNPLAYALEVATHQDPNFKLDEKLLGWIQNKTIVDCRLE